MKNRFFGLSVVTLGILSQQYAHANNDVILGFNRCGSLGDSLSTEQARGRLAWANRYYRSNQIWATYYSIGLNYLDPRTNTRLVLYPTYGVFTGGEDGQGFANIANPRQYQGGVSAEAPANLPADYTLIAMCVPSCFAPGTQVQIDSLTRGTVESLDEATVSALRTPKQGTTLGDLALASSYRQTSLGRILADLPVKNLASQPIVDIETKSGGSLSVSPQHPILTPEGNMKTASALLPGDLLVREDGSFDEVTAISSTQKAVRVFNFIMGSQVPAENIVVSNGYLTGTYYFQEKQVEFLNRQIFRANLPDAWVETEANTI